MNNNDKDVPRLHQPNSKHMEKSIASLLEATGFDPSHPHLTRTPERVSQYWLENFLDGYELDPQTILKDRYPASEDSLVVIKDIHFHGLCPHHLLPFFGKAHVIYVPNKWVVGFSRLAELVRCFTHRFTLQETATQQIAHALMDELGALGAGCVMEATHTCMTLRKGDHQQSKILTNLFLGSLKDSPPWDQIYSSSS